MIDIQEVPEPDDRLFHLRRFFDNRERLQECPTVRLSCRRSVIRFTARAHCLEDSKRLLQKDLQPRWCCCNLVPNAPFEQILRTGRGQRLYTCRTPTQARKAGLAKPC